MLYKKTGSDGGLWVTTFSGTRTPLQEYDLDTRNDIYHIVEISNYHTYPLDTVVCNGNISPSTQRLIQFVSTISTNTDIAWQDTISSLAANGQKTLQDIQLLSLMNGSGKESVSTEVEGASSLWGIEKVSITITVTV